MPSVSVEELVKKYGKTMAVNNVSFVAEDRKITTLLGPSGCGKTTTLRCIAGLEKPDHGKVSVGDTVLVSDHVFLPPEKRNIGMVFQSYAIWPHMNVFDNIAFPLKLRKAPADETKERVRRVLESVRLGGLGKRPATDLSDGQQQRVALARALVCEPSVLLLDEPLSNLDAALRRQMRTELKDIQQRVNVTTVYVTHDQAEALALSDKIILMRSGEIVEMGRPDDIYLKPKSRFAAEFIGRTNMFDGVVADVLADGRAAVKTALGTLVGDLAQDIKANEKACVMIKPECITFSRSKPEDAENVVEGEIVHSVYMGGRVEYHIESNGIILRADTLVTRSSVLLQPKEKVFLKIDDVNITSVR